jgi:hypothetical protein
MMANKAYIPNENTPDFICRTNGNIVVNKTEKYQKTPNKQIEEEDWDKFKEPYLFKKWNPSELRGYVSNEFRSLMFTD